MNEKKLLFDNAVFLLNAKRHVVKSTKLMEGKLSVFTDRQTFVFYESELDEFLTKIIFIEKESNSEVIVVESEKEVVKNEIVAKNENFALPLKDKVYSAEVISSNDRSNRIAEKLETMFNQIELNPTPEKLKQASSMVQLSNAIVANEIMKFKLLNSK